MDISLEPHRMCDRTPVALSITIFSVERRGLRHTFRHSIFRFPDPGVDPSGTPVSVVLYIIRCRDGLHVKPRKEETCTFDAALFAACVEGNR